jgi:hypothetical protein
MGVAWYSEPNIVNSILWSDSATSNAEVFNDNSSNVSISYSDVQGGWAGDNNIDIDPLFRDPENEDYHLMATYCGDPFDSPCIDMGHPDLLDSLIDCDWGLGSLRSDISAFSGGDSAGVDVMDNDIALPKHYFLKQNFPNPFNHSTIIEYILPHSCHVSLNIYDILGRRVTTLVNKKQPAGIYKVYWQAEIQPSGLYFYRLTTGEFIATKKATLLK